MLIPSTAGTVGLYFALGSLVPTAIWLILMAPRLFMLAQGGSLQETERPAQAGARELPLGVASNYLVTLEVIGRKSDRPVSLPVVVAVVDRERYLVSRLGEHVQQAVAEQACTSPVVQPLWKKAEDRARDPSGKG